jgi:hypothetical protein
MSLVRLEKMAAIARDIILTSSRVLTHNELHVVVIFEARQAAHFESKIIVGVNGNRDSPLESTFWQALLVQSCRRCGKNCIDIPRPKVPFHHVLWLIRPPSRFIDLIVLNRFHGQAAPGRC